MIRQTMAVPNTLRFSSRSADLIGEYMYSCQTQYGDAHKEKRYSKLLQDIITAEHTEKPAHRMRLPSYVRIYQTDSDHYLYAKYEPKFCYTSCAFTAMNRKLLALYASLVRLLGISKAENLRSALVYGDNRIVWGNIYLPASSIYRGERFFRTFTTVNYADIDAVFAGIAESDAINAKFDALAHRILKR